MLGALMEAGLVPFKWSSDAVNDIAAAVAGSAGLYLTILFIAGGIAVTKRPTEKTPSDN